MWMASWPGGSHAKTLRFAELYIAALAMLADPRPPLRVGALRSLELLGQRYPVHRQAIVDVVCAYLRMPTGEDGPVRLTAQLILADHLRPSGTVGRFWPHLGLDLTAATLTDFDLSGCRIDGDVRLDYVVFQGAARFRGTVFGGPASLRGAMFHDHAWLERATFRGPAVFDTAVFRGDAWFGEATFVGRTSFAAADFGGHAWFGACEARGPIDFSGATFRRSAGFRGAEIYSGARLTGTNFFGPARVSRRGEEWNLCPAGWRVEVDPNNESVGQLVWTGDFSQAESTPA